MHDQGKIDAVKKLLGEGRLSHRAIAKQVGVGRTLVGSVASGVWDERRLRRRARGPAASGPKPFDESADLVRCPYHGLVHRPCWACEIVSLKEIGAIPPCPGPHPDHAEHPDAHG